MFHVKQCDQRSQNRAQTPLIRLLLIDCICGRNWRMNFYFSSDKDLTAHIYQKYWNVTWWHPRNSTCLWNCRRLNFTQLFACFKRYGFYFLIIEIAISIIFILFANLEINLRIKKIKKITNFIHAGFAIEKLEKHSTKESLQIIRDFITESEQHL